MAILCTAVGVRADLTDFRVNDDNAAVEHSHSKIAVVEGVGFAVIWADQRNGNSDIFIQRYDLGGQPLGGNGRVNDDNATFHQSGPAIAVDLTGAYSTVWQDYRNGVYPFDPSVYFQRFDSTFTKIGTNRNLTTESPDTLKENPDIDLSPWGNGVIVWADYRNHNWDVYGQMIASNGSLIGSNFRVNDDVGSAQQHAPRVSISSEGWFVIAWYDNRMGTDDIFVQRFDSAGQKLGANIRINSDNTGTRQAFPDIAADGSGHFTIVWVDWRNGTYPANPDIFSRRFDQQGQALTADRKVNTDGTARAQREPCIAADRMGNVAVIWSDSTGSSWDIVGQMIDVDGSIREPNFRANLLGDSAQLQPDVVLDGRSRYVTWTDRRNGRYDIYASIATYNDRSLTASPASLSFSMDISEGGKSLPLIVYHIGYNQIDFQIISSVSWLTVAPSSGKTPDTITVSVAPGRPYGSFTGELRLIDTLRHDSSAIVPVQLVMTAPELGLAGDTVWLEGVAHNPDTSIHRMTIHNAGTGTLNWSAQATESWVWLSRNSGTEGDLLTVGAVTELLDTGTYTGSVIFSSAEAVDSPDTIVIALNVRAFADDTVTLGTANCQTQAVFQMPITLASGGGISRLELPLSYDTSWIVVDSIRAENAIPPTMAMTSAIDNNVGITTLTLTGTGFDTIPSGAHQIATLYGTSRLQEGVAYIDPAYVDTVSPLVVHYGGDTVALHVKPGSITIGSSTSIKEPTDMLPSQFALAQNYPNPFNGETVISFEIPSRGHVTLEIFNVLGQLVALPIDRVCPAGDYRIQWDGHFRNGRPAPSGIYFYRLRSSHDSAVRKMVLLK